MKKQVAFSLIGGRHHYLHIVPVAAALSHYEDIDVALYVPHGTDEAALRTMLSELNAASVKIINSAALAFPWLPESMAQKWEGMKLPKLLYWAKSIRSADAIIAAERTSTLFKSLPSACPTMIHIPHGVGDREKGFESRIRLYDHVIVGGEKDRQRMIAQGLVPESNCHVSGGIKLSAVYRLYKEDRPVLFQNQRPIVFYNAHFDDTLASWAPHAKKIISAVAKSDHFNLVVAPHIRRFSGKSDTEKEHWKKLAIPDKIIIDLGSDRLVNMTYTLAADVYLGDISSQVYEFISRPRPCAFINSHDIKWQQENNYRMWQLGEVIGAEDDIIAALENAIAKHPKYHQTQIESGHAAFGNMELDAAGTAAEIIDRIVGG